MATDGELDFSGLAAGDRVRLSQSTGAKYGQEGGAIGGDGVLEVVGATKHAIHLAHQGRARRHRPWDDLATRGGRVRLAYGDASTIHTAQGSTSRRAHRRLTGRQSGGRWLAGYSANTRYRQRLDPDQRGGRDGSRSANAAR